MRRKIFNLLIILLGTILLIGFLKYFIKKDTIQTQQSRLDFFSENLDIQKNNILGSFLKSSSLMYSEIIRNNKIINTINSSTEADSVSFLKIQSELKNQIFPYFANLKKEGFSSLSVIIKNSGSFFIFNINNGSCELCKPDFVEWLFDHSENHPLCGAKAENKQIGYSFIFPIFQGKNSTPVAFIEICFDLQILKALLAKNLPQNNVGFLIYSTEKSNYENMNNGSPLHFMGISENVFTNQNLKQITGLSLHEKDCAQINSSLGKALKNNANNNFSIYLHSLKNPKTLSFSEINYLGNDKKIVVFSHCTDHILNKTKEWNNQIFIINLIILLLAMFGIIYLYINRVNILNEKRDIEHSELKLKELNKSKDKFFSILAHDLKNPFNGIMGMSGYLNESYDNIDDAEKKEIINDINISSKNAFNLLQNLLEWTRTQSGQIKNAPVKIEPKNIIDLSLETVLKIAKNKEIEIIQIFHTNKNGYADENLVSTVLRNLFTNAVKFSPRNSKVEVIVSHFENELVFCVKDSGIGLRNEEIDKLFRIDVNFHKKGTEDETGTGLGLKICKEFVEYCHGRIWVISEHGVGSSFFFTIPIYH
jgi:signal transduction histidine kinase